MDRISFFRFALRRWLRRAGTERMEDLTRLAIADARSKGVDEEAGIAAIDQLRNRVAAIEQAGTALSRTDLAVDGTLLIKELSLPPGRLVGEVLSALLEIVTDDPGANERETLVAEACRWLARRHSTQP